MDSDPKLKDKILASLYTDTLSLVSFPVLEGLDGLMVPLWKNPVSIQVNSRKSGEYLLGQAQRGPTYDHPAASSLIIEHMQTRSKPEQHAMPTDSKGHSLDSISYKCYVSASLNFRTVSYETVMDGY